MGTYVVLAVVAVIVVIAVLSSRKHFRGEGGCCGGGGDIVEKKKLDGKIIAKKTIHIEGMHCINCQNAVEKQINRIDGAAAEASFKKNTAVVSMTRDVSDDELTEAVERADFKVISID